MHQTIDFRERTTRLNPLFILLAVMVLLLFLGGSTALSWYVDALWFGSLGYGEVFWKSWSLEWATFAVFAVATFLILYGWFRALWAMHRRELPQDRAVYLGRQQLRLPLRTALRLVGVLVPLGIAVI